MPSSSSMRKRDLNQTILYTVGTLTSARDALTSAATLPFLLAFYSFYRGKLAEAAVLALVATYNFAVASHLR